MLLTFSTDDLKNRILAGTKTQTIREDSTERWKTGNLIHFWRGNPRNMRPDQPNNPHAFGEGMASKVVPVDMSLDEGILMVSVDGKLLTRKELHDFVKADGFNNQIDFNAHFFPNRLNGHFTGRVISWEFDKCNFNN